MGELGFELSGEGPLRARSREGSIYIDPIGLCRSTFDPADAVLPLVPSLVAAPRAELPLAGLGALYFAVARAGKTREVRLFSRLESSSSWDKLRASGGCGLTPDERLVACHLIEMLSSRCRLVTDYPSDGAIQRRFGDRIYFLSELEPPDALSTLRAIGERGPRNSYLPRDGNIGCVKRPPGPRLFGPDLVRRLGEWCSFRPP